MEADIVGSSACPADDTEEDDSQESNSKRRKPSQQVPLILLDFDGVVCPIPEKSCDPMNSAWEDMLQGFADGLVAWAPDVVNRLNHWSSQGFAEVRWLSYRHRQAQTTLAPLLGLCHFELATHPHYVFEFDKFNKLKAANALAKAEPTRPLVWVDDSLKTIMYLKKNKLEEWDLVSRLNNLRYWRSRPNTLLLVPHNGLLAQHLDVIERFLLNPTTSDTNNLIAAGMV